ncbi:MAG: type IX secretion system protein PorQ [Bacteroidales bacterium]|nr:type IX secretion system protein PorQ [Bacteroidales bacterium]
MLRKISYITFISSFAFILNAQTGGDNVYEFLNLTHSGLVTSLGGSNVSLYTNNLNLANHNPALLSRDMDQALALNYTNYFAGINYGSAMYSRSFPGTGNFAAGLTYLNYGTFTEADPSGNITGTFKASEYAFSLIYSRELDSSFTAGACLKPILSHLEKYTSFGIAFDLGASYHSRNDLLSAGIVIRNAGLQITTYAGEKRQKLPFEIQAGVSYRLAHAPLRFSLTLRHLEKFDLTHQYNDSINADNTTPSSQSFFENVMRHAIPGVELIPHKNFYFSAGYNYQRRKELQHDAKISSIGFCWGFGIITSFLNLEFGRARYHLAGSSNNISLILRTDMLYQRFRK